MTRDIKKYSKHSIAIIGYRATGKTTVGKVVARELGWTFLDMDDLLIQRFGMTISQWVSINGWEAFRNKETELLRECATMERVVLATGGGVIERAENRKVLKENFLVVWLRSSVEEIVDRLSRDEKSLTHRPSLTERGLLEEVWTVYALREPLYNEVAEVIIEVDKRKPEEIKDLILGVKRL
ncbi:MAG: shikimate kinase [Syntrophobacterales bacterium]|nr:shikimate kinase [Syntrophobacterales bacterium]